MASTDESDDELYRRDVPPSLFAKSTFSTHNQDVEQDRRDSGIDTSFVPGSVHHEVAGTIFLRRGSETAKQPVTNRATEGSVEIKNEEFPGRLNMPRRKPSYTPSYGRGNAAREGERVFLRRRSLSTPPLQVADRKVSAASEPKSSDIAPQTSAQSSPAEEVASECGTDTPGLPERPPPALSEPPSSPPLDSEAWVERNHLRENYQAIQRAMNVRLADEDAERKRLAEKRTRKAQIMAKRKRIHLADTLEERGRALQDVLRAIDSNEWPYSIPSYHPYLKERVRDDAAFFYAYMEQELDLHHVMHGRLESIWEVGFLSERDLSEEREYLLDQLEIRHADMKHAEDVWRYYLRQQTEIMANDLVTTSILSELQNNILGQLKGFKELLCSELVAIVEQFPGLNDHVKAWQVYKYLVVARPKALKKALHEACTTELAEPDPEPAVSNPVPQMTPGGRVIPARQPLQSAYIDGWPGKWRRRPTGLAKGHPPRRPPGRPLTPPDDLFPATTVSSDGGVRQEENQSKPRRRKVQFIIGPDSDSTDSDDESSDDSSTDSGSGSIDNWTNVFQGRRTSIARPVLETVVEIPESTEDGESEAEEWSRAPPCPKLDATQVSELDGDLHDYHKSLDVSPQKPEPTELAGSDTEPRVLTENDNPISEVPRVPSLKSILDFMSDKRQDAEPTSQSHPQVPRIGLPLAPQCSNVLVPTPIPHCTPLSSTPTQTSSPASRISTLQPGTPMNSPSPALSNDVTDEGPVPSRLVARLETEQNRQGELNSRARWIDGVDEGMFSFFFDQLTCERC
jgi:hypothetical protein